MVVVDDDNTATDQDIITYLDRICSGYMSP